MKKCEKEKAREAATAVFRVELNEPCKHAGRFKLVRQKLRYKRFEELLAYAQRAINQKRNEVGPAAAIVLTGCSLYLP